MEEDHTLPRTEDYLVPTENEGVSDSFERKREQQRHRAARAEQEFIEGLAKELRKNRDSVAREFIEYGRQNPEGARVQLRTVWGGATDASDYSGYTYQPEEE